MIAWAIQPTRRQGPRFRGDCCGGANDAIRQNPPAGSDASNRTEEKLGDPMNHRFTSAARQVGAGRGLCRRAGGVAHAPRAPAVHRGAGRRSHPSCAGQRPKAGKAASHALRPPRIAAKSDDSDRRSRPTTLTPPDDGTAAKDDDDANIAIQPARHRTIGTKGRSASVWRRSAPTAKYDSFQDFVQDAPWLAGLVFDRAAGVPQFRC